MVGEGLADAEILPARAQERWLSAESARLRVADAPYREWAACAHGEACLQRVVDLVQSRATRGHARPPCHGQLWPSTAAGGIRPDESSQRVSTLNRHRCVGRAWFINCTQRHRGSGCGCQSARHRYALRRVCQRLRSGNWRSSVTRVSIPRLPDAAQTSLVKADLRMGAQGLQTPIGGLPRRTIGAPAVRIAHPVTPITPRKTMPNGSVRADC
jgi:hypothetical protein